MTPPVTLPGDKPAPVSASTPMVVPDPAAALIVPATEPPDAILDGEAPLPSFRNGR